MACSARLDHFVSAIVQHEGRVPGHVGLEILEIPDDQRVPEVMLTQRHLLAMLRLKHIEVIVLSDEPDFLAREIRFLACVIQCLNPKNAIVLIYWYDGTAHSSII